MKRLCEYLPGAKFRVPWMDSCPLNRGVLKKRFHCIILYLSVQLRTNTYKTELLLIFVSIVIIIITSFTKDKHITFRHL